MKYLMALGVGALLTSCFFNTDNSVETSLQNQKATAWKELKVVEPQTSFRNRTEEPMVWGSSWGLDSLDSIVSGIRDTIYPEKCAEKATKGVNVYFRYTPVYSAKTIFDSEIIVSEKEREIKNPGKLYTLGNWKFINEINEGVHLLDNTDPSNPIYKSFIRIPGNIDIAVKNTTLYANVWSSFVAIDFSKPTSITLKKVVPKSFANVNKRGYPMLNDEGAILMHWVQDTVVNYYCYEEYEYYEDDAVFSSSASEDAVETSLQTTTTKNSTGKGGSLARFALSDDYLYAIDRSNLVLFQITEDANPKKWSTQNVGWGLETIIRKDTALFIGSETGMIIYSLKGMGNLSLASRYQHVRSCDPVVVENGLAYVTLRGGSRCWGGENRLDIIDVSDIYNPKEKATYSMNNPHGLAIRESILFLCDGEAGLKIFDATNSKALKLLSHIDTFFAQDIILDGDLAAIMTPEGMLQFNIKDLSKPVQISATTR